MTISGVSHYRGGTIDEVAPLANRLKAVYLKHGVNYRLSQFQTGPNVGDWLVVVQYADQTAYENVQAAIAQDSECQQVFAAIAKFAKRISRDRSLISIFDPRIWRHHPRRTLSSACSASSMTCASRQDHRRLLPRQHPEGGV